MRYSARVAEVAFANAPSSTHSLAAAMCRCHTENGALKVKGARSRNRIVGLSPERAWRVAPLGEAFARRLSRPCRRAAHPGSFRSPGPNRHQQRGRARIEIDHQEQFVVMLLQGHSRLAGRTWTLAFSAPRAKCPMQRCCHRIADQAGLLVLAVPPPDGLERGALPQVVFDHADAGHLDRLAEPDAIHARPGSFLPDDRAEAASEFRHPAGDPDLLSQPRHLLVLPRPGLDCPVPAWTNIAEWHHLSIRTDT